MIRSSQTEEVTVEFRFRAGVIDYLLISRDDWMVIDCLSYQVSFQSWGMPSVIGHFCVRWVLFWRCPDFLLLFNVDLRVFRILR